MKYIIPLVISVGLCYLLFTGIDFHDMLAIVRSECTFGWILAGMGVTLVSFVCRALRWRLQLRALGINPPVHALILSIFGTYAVNLVLPRLGEVWRCGYIAKRQDAPFPAVFGSMIADRLADTLMVFILAVVTFVLATAAASQFVGENTGSLERLRAMATSPWIWAAVAAGVTLLWLFMRWRTELRWVVAVQRFIRELWEGFAAIVRMKGKVQWLLWTGGIWGCFAASMYLNFHAFPFTKEVIMRFGMISVLVTFVLGSISMALPTMGGIGPWQWAVIFALGIYDVGRTEAAAFANLVLGTQTVMLIIVGIITFGAIAMDRRALDRKNNNDIKQNQKPT